MDEMELKQEAMELMEEETLTQAEQLQARIEELIEAIDQIGRALGLEANEGRTGAEEILEELRIRQRKQDKSSALRAVKAKRWLEELRRQELALRELLPDFRLDMAMEDPLFLRLTAPHTGLSLEAAWFALHHREIAQALARSGADWAVRSVEAGALRPRELGGGQAPSAQSQDPRSMSREQREELKRRIYQAQAQGRKLPL